MTACPKYVEISKTANTDNTTPYISNIDYKTWDYMKQNRYNAAKKADTITLNNYCEIGLNDYKDIIALFKTDIETLITKMEYGNATDKDLHTLKRWTVCYEIFSWRVKNMDRVYYNTVLDELNQFKNYIAQW
jgi:hypothetical protein